MIDPQIDMTRRRPVWKAISNLFLDDELDERVYRNVAQTIEDSAYSPSEIDAILWDEVFPILEFNLRAIAGVWAGFSIEWLEDRIVSDGPSSNACEYTESLRIIQEEWARVCEFLPNEFRTQNPGRHWRKDTHD